MLIPYTTKLLRKSKSKINKGLSFLAYTMFFFDFMKFQSELPDENH